MSLPLKPPPASLAAVKLHCRVASLEHDAATSQRQLLEALERLQLAQEACLLYFHTLVECWSEALGSSGKIHIWSCAGKEA